MMARLTDRHGLLPLLVCGGVVLGALALVGLPEARMRTIQQGQVPLAERALRFEDMPDGAIVIRDHANGALLGRFPVAEGGFVRGTLRALTRERRQEGEGREAPFRLAAWPNGQLTLDDAATGRRIDLTAFGHTQTEVFARFLGAPGGDR